MILLPKGSQMRMPGAKVCVLNLTAPECALLLMLTAAACGSPAESGAGAAQSRQTAAPALREVVSFESVREEASTHVIEIKNFKFVPNVIIVQKGDRIRWKNLDVVPHTATAGDKIWDSESMANQAEWSLTVNETGVIEYICAYHPAMKGRLIVEE